MPSSESAKMIKRNELARKVQWETFDDVQWFIREGWEFEYHEGLIDKTSSYTRYEEDSMTLKNDRYIIQINVSSCDVVLQLIHDNESFYGGTPTIFLSKDEVLHLYKILKYLYSVINSNTVE